MWSIPKSFLAVADTKGKPLQMCSGRAHWMWRRQQPWGFTNYRHRACWCTKSFLGRTRNWVRCGVYLVQVGRRGSINPCRQTRRDWSNSSNCSQDVPRLFNLCVDSACLEHFMLHRNQLRTTLMRQCAWTWTGTKICFVVRVVSFPMPTEFLVVSGLLFECCTTAVSLGLRVLISQHFGTHTSWSTRIFGWHVQSARAESKTWGALSSLTLYCIARSYAFTCPWEWNPAYMHVTVTYVGTFTCVQWSCTLSSLHESQAIRWQQTIVFEFSFEVICTVSRKYVITVVTQACLEVCRHRFW